MVVAHIVYPDSVIVVVIEVLGAKNAKNICALQSYTAECFVTNGYKLQGCAWHIAVMYMVFTQQPWLHPCSTDVVLVCYMMITLQGCLHVKVAMEYRLLQHVYNM
jgi:hypothetical protein